VGLHAASFAINNQTINIQPCLRRTHLVDAVA
jgi:hypothetical protein